MNPRELLLKRHESMQPKLDTVRESAIDDLVGRGCRRAIGAAPQSPFSFADLLRPFRWHVIGLSAAWMIIVLFNIEAASPSSQTVAAKSSPQRIFLALRENREQLLQLLDASNPDVTPSAFVPRRRSELPPLTATV